MTMRLFCTLAIGFCALLWYPAFHYQGVLRVLAISFLAMAVITTFLERADPPAPSKK
ncbi:hypothetical protein [Acetobacter okinawensis]|uniref:hypothetical protein n=1 Tax=Acetobacter okinawensis TaxID=1076594 RepID=UPI000B191529|nr:hypothetical protein [Acetobacter okinawensis]